MFYYSMLEIIIYNLVRVKANIVYTSSFIYNKQLKIVFFKYFCCLLEDALHEMLTYLMK